MSDNEELDPALAKALRDIPPAGAALRDAHIAAALAEMNPSVRRAPGRLRILTGVAAAAVVALGGAAFVAHIGIKVMRNEESVVFGILKTAVYLSLVLVVNMRVFMS